MQEQILEKLETILGKDGVVADRTHILNYLADETPLPVRPQPADDIVLVKPANSQQVASVLRLANEFVIPIFPRGGGTGLSGGAVPTKNGIVISLERMRKVEVDNANMMAVAEAGVTLTELAKVAGEANLTFPPHPGDETAQIGGMVATNAGGSRAVKHGVMRNHVREIEVVLATGEILHLGRRVHKNNVGYDLMQLVIGSEGTLGIITKATIQLYPKPLAQLTLIVPYDDRHNAIATVPKILREGITPLAVEYVELSLLERTAKHLGSRWPATKGKCCLIIILDGTSNDELISQSFAISKICQQYSKYEIAAAESPTDQSNILRIRSGVYASLKSETIEILDITVPISELEHVIDAIARAAVNYDPEIPIFGHAADGNVHVHIMKRSGNVEAGEKMKDEIYRITIDAGGVITGEHGIGKIRLSSLPMSLERKELELMREIKKIFDPNGILNPGTKIT